MGRFYRTSAATPVDYMYRVNAPLMQAVSEATDKYINQYLANIDKEKMLGTQFEYAPQDTEKAQAVMQKYGEEADSVTEAIHKDPANWMNQRTALEGLTKDLYKQYTTGEISKYAGNAARRKQAFDAADKMAQLYVESGGTKGQRPDYVERFKQSWDEGFKGTNYDPNNPNAYNIYKGGTVPMYQDLPKMMEDAVAKIKADKIYNYHETDAGALWTNQITHEEELLTPDRIAAVAMGVIGPDQRSYLAQLASVGIIDPKSITGEAYTTPLTGISPDQQKQIDDYKDKIARTKNKEIKQAMQNALDSQVAELKAKREFKLNQDNYFAPTLARLTNTYRVDNLKDETKKVGDPGKIAMYTQGQENWRLKQRLTYDKNKDEAEQKQKDAELAERIRDDTMKNNIELWKAGKTGTGGVGGVGGKPGTRLMFDSQGNIVEIPASSANVKFPAVTQKSDISTTDFAGMTIHDPVTNQEIPFYSKAGQAAQINLKTQEERQLRLDIRANDIILSNQWIDSDTRNRYEEMKQDNLTKLDQVIKEHQVATAMYKSSVYAVMNDSPGAGTPLSQGEKDLYNKYVSAGDPTGDKAIALADRLSKQSSDLLAQIGQTPTLGLKTTEEMKAAQKEDVAKSQKATDLFRQSMVLRAEAKQFKEVDKKFRENSETWFNTMRNHPLDNDAIQLSGGDSQLVGEMLLNNTSSERLQILDASGRDISGQKLVGKGVEGLSLTFAGGNIQKFLDITGTGLHVMHIGNTSRMGNGNAVAEVQMDGVAGKFYVPLTDALQRKVVAMFANNPDKEVAGVAADIADDEARFIRSQLTNPSTATVNQSKEGKEIEHPVTVPVKGGTVTLSVAEYTNRDGTKTYFVSMPIGGKLVAMPKLTISAKGAIVPDVTDNKKGMFKSEDELIKQIKLHKYVASNP